MIVKGQEVQEFLSSMCEMGAGRRKGKARERKGEARRRKREVHVRKKGARMTERGEVKEQAVHCVVGNDCIKHGQRMLTSKVKQPEGKIAGI